MIVGTNNKEVVYIIGSLRLPTVRLLATRLRREGFDVFDDWHAAGPAADDIWQTYEQERNHSYIEALNGYHAREVFDFDYRHLSRADLGVMIMPAGKSCHLELGYLLGRGKRGYILLDKEPERWDIMYRFATGVFLEEDALISELKCPKGVIDAT